MSRTPSPSPAATDPAEILARALSGGALPDAATAWLVERGEVKR